jgi:diguanylate cyclase (GGDEF)-like protein/PAS domain S-box-containing protein
MKLYQNITLQSPYGIVVLTLLDETLNFNLQVVEMNHRFEQLTGITEQTVIGKNFEEVFTTWNIDNTDFISICRDILTNKKSKEMNHYIEAKQSWIHMKIFTPMENYIAIQIYDFPDSMNVQYENFFSVNLDLLCIADVNGNFVKVNKEWEEVLGYTSEELEKRTFLEFVHPDDYERTIRTLNTLSGKKDVRNFVNRYRSKDGSYRYIEWKSHPYGDWIYASARDITEEVYLELQLNEKDQLMKTIFENAPVGIWITYPSGKPTFMNKYTKENFAATEEEIIQCRLTDQETNEQDGPKYYEETITYKDGKKHTLETVKTKLFTKDGSVLGTLGIGLDITSRKIFENEVLYLSYHDQLTGVFNRRFYEEELIRMDTMDNYPITLVMADVNGLKLANDAFGHALGDKLLVTFANILIRECRAEDIIARIGGDEFVLLLPNTSIKQAEKIVERIHAAASNTFVDKIMLSVSFGLKTKTTLEDDFDKIYKQAEDAMYRRKLMESKSFKSNTIKLITKSLYEKSPKEKVHSERVSELCRKIGEAMGMSLDDINELGLVGLLHDIGKIGVDEQILNKPGSLTEEELEQVRRHPEIGYHILKSLSEFADIADHVLAHHERPDGKGYPKGLHSAQIPLKAKILFVADAYEDMTNEFRNHKVLSKEEVIQELKKDAGTKFDEEVVKILLEKVLFDYNDLLKI